MTLHRLHAESPSAPSASEPMPHSRWLLHPKNGPKGDTEQARQVDAWYKARADLAWAEVRARG